MPVQTPLLPHRKARRTRVLLALRLIVLVAGVTVWFATRGGPESPEVAYWIRGHAWMDPTLTWEQNDKRRVDALRQLGEPAVRDLIKDLRRGDDKTSNVGILSVVRRM